MRFKAPRWLLVLEALVLVGAMLALAYKAAMWVRPLGRIEVERRATRSGPGVRADAYYRQYPASYIHISRESWRFDPRSHISYHAFTLRNSAAVAYRDITVRFSYESADGRQLLVEEVNLPGILAIQESREVRDVRVQGLPREAVTVRMSVEAAEPIQ